jgi:hypothetical protein
MTLENPNTRSTKFAPEILLRIFRMIKQRPSRIWVATDFGHSRNMAVHLRLLQHLGLIEKVDVRYINGTRYTKGYKLLVVKK